MFKPSAEERVWAVLAHLSTLAMGIGLPLPIAGWSMSRRQSNYISFQCLQALGYQTLGYTIWILTTLVMLVVSAVGFASSVQTIDTLDADLNAWVIGHSVFMFGMIGLYFFLPAIAAVACALGMNFRYPLMGNRLARYLGYDLTCSREEQPWLIEEHEDRWVASMGHFAVVIVFWGLLAPILAWAMQGKRSLFLKFQSIQTVVYQAGTILLYFAAGFLYLFGLVVFVLTIGFEGDVALDSSSSMIGAVVFSVSLFMAMLVILVVPLLHILGQWAGYRVLKGDEYRYPVVGGLVEKWIPDPALQSTVESH
ncbi:MAG TPA: DUF4870 domain-containing protein [Anaerolineales bacterium]|nr:DUF4870 domain-containing protein [Anaerolineales bacterium]